MICMTCNDTGIGAVGPDGEPSGEDCPDCPPLPFPEIDQATAEHALRLLYRMALWLRGRWGEGGELAQEASGLMCDLSDAHPGVLGQLAESKDTGKASDYKVR